MRISTYIQKILFYISSFLFLLVFCIGIGLLITNNMHFIVMLVSGFVLNGIRVFKDIELFSYLIAFFVGIICVAVGAIITRINAKYDTDRYSIRKESIKKIIEKKEADYEKVKDKYYY